MYDLFVERATRTVRHRAVELLDLRPGQNLLIVGIGTGLDLPYVPPGIRVTGVDLSQGMLRRAARRVAELRFSNVDLRKMDAQALALPDESFDAVYLPLIVAIVPDGAAVLREAARVARPGARLVVLDKFWPEGRPPPTSLRTLSKLSGRFITHFDRRFSEVHAGAPRLEVLTDEPALFGGYFRLIALRKR